jgi:hypothetical protein
MSNTFEEVFHFIVQVPHSFEFKLHKELTELQDYFLRFRFLFQVRKPWND